MLLNASIIQTYSGFIAHRTGSRMGAASVASAVLSLNCIVQSVHTYLCTYVYIVGQAHFQDKLVRLN